MSGADYFILNESTTSLLELFSAKVSDSGDYICEVANKAGSASCAARLFIKEPPYFIKKLDPTAIFKKGDTAIFECKVTGTPEIKVSWFKNYREISFDEKYKMTFVDSVAILEIANVILDDSGNYSCKAQNEAGSESCDIMVTVKEPPTFMKILEPAEVVKSSDVTLECEVAGTAPFEVLWYKDNKQLRRSKKYKMISDISLVSLCILTSDSSDVGEYVCVVKNDVGSCSCSSTVKLKERPTFLQTIENATVFSGNPAVFQCVVKGSGPITTSWKKDDKHVREAENIKISFENNIATLQIINAEENHSGNYICQAKNDAGTAKCFATLVVMEPANIIEKSEPLTVTSGNPAILECTVAGTPVLNVAWFKSGKQLESNRRYKLSFANKIARLKILSAEPDDSGNYAFKVQNEFGANSCDIHLTVLEQIIPPLLTRKLKEMGSTLGSFVRMEFKVSGSIPMSITWYKEDKEISASDKYKMLFQENTVSLEINELDFSDAGIYTCKAANSAGKDECSAVLSVKEPPSFTDKVMSQDVVLGSTVQFKGVVKGSTPLSTKWFKGDRELMHGVAYSIWNDGSTYFLDLLSAKISDAGSYTCQVSNDVGTDACSAELFVKEPPTFIKKLNSSTILKKGISARFECIVTGTPEIKVSWYKNCAEVVASDKYIISFDGSVAVLEIIDMVVEDSMCYVCEIRNEAGSDSCSTEVEVKEPPSFRRKLESAEVIRSSGLTLECEVAGAGPFDVMWFKDNKKIPPSEKYKMITKNVLISLHILKVDIPLVGEYKCTVTNEVGSCSCSCIVSLKEPPSFIKKIENITTFVGNSTCFQCLVTGSEPLSISWMKDNVNIKEDENISISFENNLAVLTFAAVEAKDGGKYICQAKNDAGVEKSFATLIVTGWLGILNIIS
ncbi:titin-like [Mobula hypostoma]|uniref:titin-like n=1 Tax=Mobula hypostoma TaxID=723540 RepID=UPI002FC30037